jgi:hypothetical protein
MAETAFKTDMADPFKRCKVNQEHTILNSGIQLCRELIATTMNHRYHLPNRPTAWV